MKKLSKRLRAIVLLIAAAMVFVFSPITNAREQQESSEACDGILRSYTCQALDSALDFIGGFYESVVERNLVVNPELFSSNYDGSTGHALREAWRTFRNLANLILLIGLILIILSQITGIGISSYGIKKGLPKLLMAVLLVNLSYIICQGCIDLANILGATIGDFFEELLSKAVPSNIQLDLGGTYLRALIAGLGTIVIIKQKALITKVLIGALLFLFIILLAMFTLYVILAIRQSLCILLVITSPIAFVCALIPGTKKVFDFWFDTMKAVLFAYPVCSTIVYGGAMAGAIVYASWEASGASTSLFRSLGFLLISVIPYFFVPKIIMKGLSFMESTVMQLRNFANKKGRGLLEGSLLMQSLRTQDKRMREINRSGQKIVKNADGTRSLASRFGYKGYEGTHFNESATSGPFRKTRNFMARTANRITGSRLARGETAFGDYLQRNYRNVHGNAAKSAFSAMNKMGRYRLKPDKSTWLEYDQKGNLVKRENKGKVTSFYTKSGKAVDQSTIGGKMRVAFHNAIGARFMNSQFKALGAKYRTHSKDDAGNIIGYQSAEDKDGVVRDSNGNEVAKETDFNGYLQEAQKAAGTTERKAYSDRLKTGMSSGVQTKANDLNRLINQRDIPKALATLSSLLDEGEAGRDALEAIIDNSYPDVSANLKEFVDEISSGELNKIKKKNPQLWNKIDKIRHTDEARMAGGTLSIVSQKDKEASEQMTSEQMYGMSAKQFSEMDHNSQNKLSQQLITIIENNSADAANNPEIIAAVTMAEGALYDPNIRSALSSETLANLEQIAELRHDAVENGYNAAAATDSSNIRTTINTGAFGAMNISDPNFAQNFSSAMCAAFVGGTHANDFSDAIQNGDTVRMESIMRSIDKELDTIMNQGGLVDTNQRAAQRNAIMLRVIRDMSAGSVTGNTASGGLFTADANAAVSAGGPQAKAIKRARDAETMLEQRYARRMAS